MHTNPAVTAVAVAMATIGTGAQAADPDVGLELAQDYCVRCHDITPAGAFKTFPPSFASIAAFRDASQIEARIWFQPLHSTMPRGELFLSPQNVADLVAFIQSLERSGN